MRSAAVVAWLGLATGCGRLHFDPLGDGATTSDGASCGVEICNGIDDDCDGVIDEGCPCTGFESTFPTEDVSDNAQLVWTGNGYLELASDATNEILVPVDPLGAVGTAQPIAPKSQALSVTGDNTMVWTGSELAVVWADATSQAVMFEPFDGAGVSLAPAISLGSSPAGTYPQIVSANGRLGIVWADPTRAFHTLEVAPDGTPLGAEVVYGGATGVMFAAAPDGNNYIVVGFDAAGTDTVYLLDRVAMLATGQPVTFAGTRATAIVARGPSGYLLVLTDLTSVAGQVFAPDGAASSGVLSLGPSAGSLAAASVSGSSERFVATAFDTSQNPASLLVADLDATGSPTYGPTMIASNPSGVLGNGGSTTTSGRVGVAYPWPEGPTPTMHVFQQCR